MLSTYMFLSLRNISTHKPHMYHQTFHIIFQAIKPTYILFVSNTLNLLTISSGSGNNSFISSGRESLSLYVATPIGTFDCFNAYSTYVLSLLLQMIIPIDGFSPGSFICSSSAVRYSCIFPAYFASNSPIFNSIATKLLNLL